MEIGIGDYWGPAGPGNTYHRNRVSGEGIVYHDASHQQNVLGNVTTRFKDYGGPALEKLEHGNVVNGTVEWDLVSRNMQDVTSGVYLYAVLTDINENFERKIGKFVIIR